MFHNLRHDGAHLIEHHSRYDLIYKRREAAALLCKLHHLKQHAQRMEELQNDPFYGFEENEECWFHYRAVVAIARGVWKYGLHIESPLYYNGPEALEVKPSEVDMDQYCKFLEQLRNAEYQKLISYSRVRVYEAIKDFGLKPEEVFCNSTIGFKKNNPDGVNNATPLDIFNLQLKEAEANEKIRRETDPEYEAEMLGYETSILDSEFTETNSLTPDWQTPDMWEIPNMMKKEMNGWPDLPAVEENEGLLTLTAPDILVHSFFAKSDRPSVELHIKPVIQSIGNGLRVTQLPLM